MQPLADRIRLLLVLLVAAPCRAGELPDPLFWGSEARFLEQVTSGQFDRHLELHLVQYSADPRWRSDWAAKLGRIVRRNVEQARALGDLVAADPDLELLAPVSLNIVCFRYRGSVQGEAALEALNRELLLRLHEGGLAAPSYATVHGRYALRACITNHRTRRGDLEILRRETVRLGRELENRGDQKTRRALTDPPPKLEPLTVCETRNSTESCGWKL